ncbi:MAG: hypothetical protein WDW38_006008 [Sanguina aurantia]
MLSCPQILQSSALLQNIANSATTARVGRDIIDPYEIFGFYPASDAVTSPHQATRVLELFGYLPGAESAACVAWAMQTKSSVACIDAPLKLQEAWVAALLRDFMLREADLPRQLQKELQATQAMVPQDLIAWESILAQTFAPSSSSEAVPPAENASAATEAKAVAETVQPSHTSSSPPPSPSHPGAQDVQAVKPRSAELDLLVGFKVSRAMAAAVLDPVATAEATLLQSKLQPLKYQHFSKRALYMARRIREISEGLQQNRDHRAYVLASSKAEPEAGAKATAGPSADLLARQAGLSGSSVVTDADPLVVVAVVGRQYVAEIERLWTDKNSSLWRSSVPRTFAPSSIVVDDPDVEHGGSRPVGQTYKTIGEYTGKR